MADKNCGANAYKEEEYINMLQDTGNLIAKEKSSHLGEGLAAFKESTQLTNEVEFWKWMGANYPKDLSNADLIQQAAVNKGRWLNTQLQGKGYEWDYMALQRMKPQKVLSVFEAGDCPTQPGIDITETGIFDHSVKMTYQNKAYLSNNNPDLHNTPKDAVVVTNREKVAYCKKQGYVTEEYMDSKELTSVRDSRFKKAISGKANTSYNLGNVAAATTKAGIMGAAVGITIETIGSYKRWKNGEITDKEYMKEIFSAGGEAGATAGFTSAAMIPVQAVITTAGASTLLAVPIAFVFGKAVNSVIAPCFGRGKYRQILSEAKYYQEMEKAYGDFLLAVERASAQYGQYMRNMQQQNAKYRAMRQLSKTIDKDLEKMYALI